MNKESNIFKNIIIVLLALLLFGMAAGSASAFYFRGNTYNETGVALNNTNVSIEVYQMMGGQPPTLTGTNYNSSNSSGFFNVSVTGGLDTPAYFYKIRLKHFNDNATSGTLDYTGSSLPEFPYQMISTLTVGSPMNFYLRRGGTININAINETSFPVAFKYMMKDNTLGYSISENMDANVENVNNIYVPLERNYSIMIFPRRGFGFPVSYDLNNLSTYPNNTANITFNTSTKNRWVSGYAKYNEIAGFGDLKIIAYLIEPGDTIRPAKALPYNISAKRGTPQSDQYNLTTGYFNITLPGAKMEANILLFATARNSSDDYFGAFKNITLNYSTNPVTNFNFSLQPLLGTVMNITLDNPMDDGQTNITTKKLQFQLKNQSSGENITDGAHVKVKINYSAYDGAAFNWVLDRQRRHNGSFSIPSLVGANIREISVFTQNFAPLKTSRTASQLANPPVLINLTQFKPGNPDTPDAGFSDVFIQMSKSTTACDVPYPPAGCSLTPDPSTSGNMSIGNFNPFKIVMGGGKISLRISKPTQRITVHYKNVDMLASGPPDALFDESASSSQSGSSIEEAWRFGSKGPEIYDEVLIGVPITTSGFSGIKIGKLYDENWNAIWDLSAGNTSADIPSDYSTFPSEWFSSTGPTCSTTNAASNCYINTTDGMLWLRIPHFSGIGPTILRTTTTTTSDGGGGGTGGGGITTLEPSANIATAERYDKSLIANTPVTYTFKAPELGLYEIAVTGKENENDIPIRVEALKGEAKGVTTPAPGVVYKNINIIVGTTKIKEAVIKFKVENSWLASNNLAGSEVALMKWEGSKWNMLDTGEKNKDALFTYFESKTTGFSSFAITGIKAAIPAATSPAPAVTAAAATPAVPAQTSAAAPAPTKKVPGFELVLAAAALCAIYLFGRKRR